MNWIANLFMPKEQRNREKIHARNRAIAKARKALRREKSAIDDCERHADQLRQQAVKYEKQGKCVLAQQAVRHLVQMDKQITSRSLVVGNMDFALSQVSMKSNLEEFQRGMTVVFDIEETGKISIDPDVTIERLREIAEKNRDFLAPWEEIWENDTNEQSSTPQMNQQEMDVYAAIKSDAAIEITDDTESNQDSLLADIGKRLDQKEKQSVS